MRLSILQLLLAPLAAAQGSFVVPSGFAARPGNAGDSLLCFYSPSVAQPVRLQTIWDAGSVPVAAASLKSLALRRSTAVPNPVPAALLTFTLDLAVGPNAPATASTTFAANLGANATRVFAASVNLPLLDVGPAPAPWTVTVPFSAPFAFAQSAGKGLVADFAVSSYAATPASTWYVDGADTDSGTRADNFGPQPSCTFGNGRSNNSLSWRTPWVGGTWNVSYRNLRASATGLGVLGSQGVNGTWSGLHLPIDLGAIGAPGCSWSIEVLFVRPLAADATGIAAWPDVAIPKDSRLVGASFFDQSAWLDATANVLGLVTSWSSKWTIGDNQPQNGAKVYKLQDTGGSATGVYRRSAVIVRFDY